MSGSIGPSLDLNLLGPTLDPSITFTRASTATYFDVTGTLQTGAINAPRFDYDPVAHTPRGLLIEEARTNQILQSGDITNAAWVKNSLTLAAGIPGPFGATTGSGIISNSGVFGFLTQQFVPVAGTTYTLSIFLKAGSLTTVIVIMQGPWWADAANRAVTFNLSTGLASASGGGASATMSPVGNGWYRCSLTATPDTAANAALQIARATAPGDGVTVQHYVAGGQFEAGAFPTSYIPTTTVAVTRAIDSMTIASANMAPWFNAAGPGAWAIALTSFAASGAARRLINSAGGTLIYPLWQRNGSDVGSLDGSATIFTTVTTQVGVPFKAASSWSSTPSGSICLNGGAVASGAQTIGFGALATTGVRFFSDGGTYNDCWVSRITYWPRALSNSELQDATSLSGPLLDLYLTGPALPTGLTLTRSTTGTYVDATGTIQTAAINAPRFGYDPISHAPLGLLIEETRTNLNWPSMDMSTSWATSPAGCVLGTANVTTSPDGTNNASSVVTNDTSNNSHQLYRPFTGAINTTYCGSLFVKASAYPRVSVNFGNTAFPAGSTGGLFDLTTGTIVATNGVTVCSIAAYPNGWYRVSVTATSTGTGGAYIFGFSPNPATVNVVGSNYLPASTGLGIFAWGTQVETAAFLTAPTSYIPTTTATVARAFDLCSMPTAAWYNASLGSFAVDGTMQQINAGNQDIVGFDDGSISNCTIARVTSNQFYVIEASAGVGQASANSANTILPGTPFRAAMTYNAGALTGSLNGGAVISSSGTAPVSTNRLNLSAVRQAAQNGFKSRVRYWPRVLANVELQEATSVGVQARVMVLA